MNKRDFMIGACALATGSAPAFSACAATGADTRVRARRLPPLAGQQRLATWQRYIAQRFEVDSKVGQRSMRLRRIDIAPPDRDGLEQFTLVFDERRGDALPAGTHRLRHASGQQLALYLEPGQPAPGLRTYRAHFSLLT